MSGGARLGELSALKLALMAKKVRAEAQAVLKAEPIAIVGMSCRVPGGDSPERFWELLATGSNAAREVPADRWDCDAWYDPDPAAPGKVSTKWGNFVDGIDGFDPGYFGILPREAEQMDPQQRLFLEVAVEALDDAGVPRERLRGTRSAVFVASYHNDYAQLQFADLDAIDSRTLTGPLHSVLANRLSYILDLRGPSVSIDTACSSSLVAIHLACQSLRDRESDLAIAGGVSLMLAAPLMVALSKFGVMSPDGRCKTFDASADGFGRGEGCGVIVLKRLADAISDDDRVLAVVRGSAVNQDGHSTLLAAPNGQAQQALIREALASAQLPASRIGFVEAHGTGTALGDPIEVEALAATIGRAAPGSGPCLLGAAKANIGHLEAAAGVVGTIKAVLALEHGAVPGQVGFAKLNPHIAIDGTRLEVPRELTPWARGPQPRCAAVSSFGIGGTNAHVILEEAPELPRVEPERAFAPGRLLTLSAQSPEALRALVGAWRGFLAATKDDLDDVCSTACTRRSSFDWRLAIVGKTKEELLERLAERTNAAEGSAGRRAPAAPRVALVFGGQGPQWYAMGRELLAVEPVFREAVAQVDALLRPLSGWSLLDELAAPEGASRVDRTEAAQPALFAIHVGLAALWRSWGLVPDGVVGHSVGELAALHVAGVLSLPEAVRVVHQRAEIMQGATGRGRMAQVSLTEAEALEAVRPFGERLSVAAINGPRTAVLSGEAEALQAALEALTARGVAHRALPVNYAFHSAQMAPFAERLAAALGSVAWAAPATAFYSTVTGGSAKGERFDAAYFARNVAQPVRFAAAIGAMAGDGFTAFVEIGPHPVLSASITECLDARGQEAAVVPSLRRARPEREAMLAACGRLYEAGWAPDYGALQPLGKVVSLPAYPWQRRRYWLRSRPEATSPKRAGSAHPILGWPVPTASPKLRIFEGDSGPAAAWLEDHRVYGRLVMPGAAVLEALWVAAAEALGDRAELRAFALEEPLALPEAGEPAAAWQTTVTLDDEGRAELALYQATRGPVVAETTWRRIATAGAAHGAPVAQAFEAPVTTEAVPVEDVYAGFRALGAEFGPTFRCLRDVRRVQGKDGAGAAEGWIDLPASLEAAAHRHALHPVLLDAALQLCSVAAPRGPAGELPAQVFLPLGADRLRIAPRQRGRLFARVRVEESATRASLACDVLIEAVEGENGGERRSPVLQIEGMRFARADASALAPREAAPARRPEDVYAIAWHPLAAPPQRPRVDAQASPPDEGTWLVFSDHGGVGDAVARLLNEAGDRCERVLQGPGFARTGDGSWTVNPAAPADFERLFAETARSRAGIFRGAVHLWGLDADRFDEDDSARDEDRTSGASLTASAIHVAQRLAAASPGANGPLWLVSRGAEVVTRSEAPEALRPHAAVLRGLASVIAAEHPELGVRHIDLDPDADDLAARLVEELCTSSARPRTAALRHGAWWTPRLERRATRAIDDVPLRAELARPGTIEGVEVRAVARPPLAPDEVRVRVEACALNFRDVLMTLGMYPGDPVPLGIECAGVVTAVGAEVREFAVGARVFGFAPQSLGTEATVPAAFLAPVPEALTSEQAASIPVAFLTAYYGFHRLARMARGQRVLIHAGAGGVGLAAVQLARQHGAEIFATAGSPTKRALLRALGVHHVMDSRSLAFADEIRKITGGAGVDVVLNSLAGDFIPATLGVVARGGAFLEIGKRGVMTNEEAALARPDVRYHLYDLGADAHADHGLLRPMFDAILDGLGKGELQPLPIQVFSLQAVGDALRYMAQARHVGKVIVRPRRVPSPPETPLVSRDATYWVTGGLGGVGLETARWLSRSGARSLVLSGRRPPGPDAAAALREIESHGTAVCVIAADAGDRATMQEIADRIAATLPPLRGVFHAAGVTEDAALLRQTADRCRSVFHGKVRGAWLLHELTRHVPLDFFVLYSAAGVLLDAPGQAPYSAANAELDALAQARRAAGLPALSIAWGAWADVGMAAALAARGPDVWAARGLGKITPATGFAALERLLREDATYAAFMPIDWPRFLGKLGTGADRAFFALDALAATAPPPAAARAASSPGALPEMLRALPASQRRTRLLGVLGDFARHVIGLDGSAAIDPAVPLREVGLDSLMAVELRNAVGRALGKPLQATLLFDYPTPDALADHLLRVLALDADAAHRGEAKPTAAPAATRPASLAIAELSDQEAEALLLQELEAGDIRRNHGA